LGLCPFGKLRAGVPTTTKQQSWVKAGADMERRKAPQPAGYDFRFLVAEHKMRFRQVFSVIAYLCHILVIMKCRIYVFI